MQSIADLKETLSGQLILAEYFETGGWVVYTDLENLSGQSNCKVFGSFWPGDILIWGIFLNNLSCKVFGVAVVEWVGGGDILIWISYLKNVLQVGERVGGLRVIS